jgi:hypothetical protein
MRVHFAVYTVKEGPILTGASLGSTGLRVEEAHGHVHTLEDTFGTKGAAIQKVIDLVDGFGVTAEIREIYIPDRKS